MGLFDGLFSKSRSGKSESSFGSKAKDVCQSKEGSAHDDAPQETPVRNPDTTSRNDPAIESSCETNVVDQLPVEPVQTPVAATGLPSTGVAQNDDISGQSILRSHSSKSARRTAGFLTLLRSHRRQRRTQVDPLKPQDQHISSASVGNLCDKNSIRSVSGTLGLLQVALPTDGLPDVELRKVSDNTMESMDSELTSVTICRHPSQHTSIPIILPDTQSGQNPFDEHAEGVERISGSDPFTDSTESRLQTQTRFSGETNPSRMSSSEHTRKFLNPPPNGSSLLTGSEFNTGSNCSDWSGCVDQHTATIAFNEIAVQLNLDLLPPNENLEPSSLGEPPHSTRLDAVNGPGPVGVVKLTKRRSRIFGRLRSIGSSFQLKRSGSQERTVRRMKTFAHLPSRSYEMNSLRGKSLETLARLGGHSFLTLPADFAPATLRLPACFVATGTYLRYFAPTVRNLFVDAGDLKVAVRTYAYFAEQVLSAEKEQDRIELTVRGDRIPMELVQVLEQEAPRSSSSHVLGVAWAFKALLAGLPGGILGSEQLYQVLVKISRGRLSGGDAEGRRGGLGELSPNSSARIKAIALVLLALTDAPRLNLICAVFGICAVLLHESERSAQLSRQSITGSLRGNLGTGLASVERLGGVFGRLLRGGGDDGEDGRGRQESQQVGELLVRNWRGVSRQLRIWESRRMGQTGVFSWIGEGKTGEQEADVEGDTP